MATSIKIDVTYLFLFDRPMPTETRSHQQKKTYNFDASLFEGCVCRFVWDLDGWLKIYEGSYVGY